MDKDHVRENLKVKEVQDIINNVLMAYINEYKNGRMTFSEFSIIENIIYKLQEEFDKTL